MARPGLSGGGAEALDAAYGWAFGISAVWPVQSSPRLLDADVRGDRGSGASAGPAHGSGRGGHRVAIGADVARLPLLR